MSFSVSDFITGDYNDMFCGFFLISLVHKICIQPGGTENKDSVRDRIRLPEVRIRGSRSVPQCHGSATLENHTVYCTCVDPASNFKRGRAPVPVSTRDRMLIKLLKNVFWSLKVCRVFHTKITPNTPSGEQFTKCDLSPLVLCADTAKRTGC